MRAIVISGLNTGVLSTATSAQDISDLESIVANVVQASGNIAGAVITIDQSLDGTNWFTTGVTIAGVALSNNVTINTQYFRLRVSTASGVASTANVTVQGKPGYFPFLQSSFLGMRSDMDAFSKLLAQALKNFSDTKALLLSLLQTQRRS